MAAVSLSPQPLSLSNMSMRRGPLSTIPNGGNSPHRGAAATLGGLKSKRSYASTQREDSYGQPPPAKKQMLDIGSRTTARSPVKQKATIPRGTTRVPAPERVRQEAPQKLSADAVEEVRKWYQTQRSRFPKLVFYFESIHDDQRGRLAKQIASLGGVCRRFLLLFPP